MPLLYTGQEVSLSKRLRFFERDTVDWAGPSLASWYRRVFDLWVMMFLGVICLGLLNYLGIYAKTF